MAKFLYETIFVFGLIVLILLGRRTFLLGRVFERVYNGISEQKVLARSVASKALLFVLSDEVVWLNFGVVSSRAWPQYMVFVRLQWVPLDA